MQQDDEKSLQFRKIVGKTFEKIRKKHHKTSRSVFAREYDIDRGNLSKLERGIISCSLMTAWKISEASGVRFSEFAKLLEDELGSDFKLMDE